MKFIAFLKWLIWLVLGFFISGVIGIVIDKSNLMTTLFGSLGTTIGTQINDIWWFLPLALLNLLFFHYAIGWWGAKAGLAWLLLLPYLLYAVVSTIAQGITWNITALVYLIGALVVGLTEEYIFRGALFAAFKKAGVGETALIVVSALIFAAFHMVNGLAGGNLIALVFQVLFTFGLGIFLGVIYLKTKALLPIAFAHGFYDFSVLAPGHALFNMGGITNILILTIALIILGIVYQKKIA